MMRITFNLVIISLNTGFPSYTRCPNETTAQSLLVYQSCIVKYTDDRRAGYRRQPRD